ncbi:MAG: hypothetical protein ACTTKL_05485 [Treponema sp.]
MNKFVSVSKATFFICFLFLMPLAAQTLYRITLEPEFNFSYQLIKDTPFNKENALELEPFAWHFNQKLQLEVKPLNDVFLSIGTRTEPDFFLSNWIIEYAAPSGLWKAGFYNNSIYSGPAKILKTANYFDWLFSGNNYENNKTNAAVQFNFQNASASFVYAPVYDWVPETWQEDPIVPDTGSVYYAQGQYYSGAFDSGIFAAYSQNAKNGDFAAGLWADYVVGDNTLLYAEMLWSNKNWIPYFSVRDFDITYESRQGLRGMFGVMQTFSFIPFTLYVEGMYNGSGYFKDDWQRLGNDFAEIDKYPPAAALKGAFLAKVNYSYMNMLVMALHLRSDTKFWNFLSIETTLFYYLPESFLFFPELIMDFDFGLKITMNCALPFSADPKQNIVFADCFPYVIKPRLSIEYILHFGN